MFGADEEIRTLETVIAVYTISNRAPSASSDTSANKYIGNISAANIIYYIFIQ